MENQLPKASINVCGCLDTQIKEAVKTIYDDSAIEVSDALFPTTDYCDRCQKPLGAVVQTLKSDIQAIYG
jgi:hypothetical protein